LKTKTSLSSEQASQVRPLVHFHLSADSTLTPNTPGICALIRAQKKLPNAKVAVFEKGNHVGGTWAKNTYPGLSCDIHSQVGTSLLSSHESGTITA
jgi:hypothetical protein